MAFFLSFWRAWAIINIRRFTISWILRKRTELYILTVKKKQGHDRSRTHLETHLKISLVSVCIYNQHLSNIMCLECWNFLVKLLLHGSKKRRDCVHVSGRFGCEKSWLQRTAVRKQTIWLVFQCHRRKKTHYAPSANVLINKTRNLNYHTKF
jgi:hypothetical protein